MKVKTIFFIIGLIAFQSSLICSIQDAEDPLLHERKESRLKKLICSPAGCVAGVLLSAAALTAITLAVHPFPHDNPNPAPACDNSAIPACNITHTQTQCNDTALDDQGYIIAPFKVRAYNCHGCTIATDTFVHGGAWQWINRYAYKTDVQNACGGNATVCFEKDECSYRVNNTEICCSFNQPSWWQQLLRFQPCNPTLVPPCFLSKAEVEVNTTKIGKLGKVATRFRHGKKVSQSFKRYPKKPKKTQWVNNGIQQRSKKQMFNSGR